MAHIRSLATDRNGVFPAGVAAANMLGFTTQNAARIELATVGSSLPRLLLGKDALVHTRRPADWRTLSDKDYYVTEALRIIEQATESRVIFKGGTSLSKGWNLIQRFSEDIDIFLAPTAYTPPLGKKGIDRELKKPRQEIERHPALARMHVFRQRSKIWTCSGMP
jgi:hypothetical protein